MRKYRKYFSIIVLSALPLAVVAKPNTQRAAGESAAEASAGFRLTEVKPGSLYDKLGLQKGDLLKEINGQAVADEAQTIQALNGLYSVKIIKLKVLRDGKPKTLSVKMHQ